LKLAVVKLSAMGDIIHAMVALQFIKQRFPIIQIDWIVEAGFAAVLKDNPDIDNILPINLKAIKKDKSEIFTQIKLLREYAQNDYDLVIDAQGLIKSAITAKLLGNKIAGFDKESIREGIASWFYDVKVNIAYDENTIDRNATVLSQPLGFEITHDDILNKKSFLFFKETKETEKIYQDFFSQKTIVFIIGSTWESRNYPKEKFAKIADNLKENCLIVWASEDEKEKAKWIEENSLYAKMLPKIDLNVLKAVIAKSDLLIGNDTGPTHMAWGFNIPSITIFGPTPVNRVYQTKINKVVKSSSVVNHYKLDKNDYSIRDINENEIIVIAKELLI